MGIKPYPTFPSLLSLSVYREGDEPPTIYIASFLYTERREGEKVVRCFLATF